MGSRSTENELSCIHCLIRPSRKQQLYLPVVIRLFGRGADGVDNCISMLSIRNAVLLLRGMYVLYLEMVI